MRRILLLLPPPILLAGCAGGAPPPSAGPQPSAPIAQLRAGFPPHGLADTIEVDAVERLPLRAAELVAPDGAATPANYLAVTDAPRLATGQVATSNAWQDALTGNNALAALTLSNAQAGAALRGAAQLLAMGSTADIPLPDPVAYRRDWTHYHIRLTFGTPPGEVETRDIPAPAPPPAE